MQTQLFNASRYLTAMEPFSGISISPEWQADVELHLATAARMAATLDTVPLDDTHIALSSVFVASDPGA